MGYDSTPKGKRPAHRAALRFPDRNARLNVHSTFKMEPVPEPVGPPLQLVIPGFEAEIAKLDGFSYEEYNKNLDDKAGVDAEAALRRYIFPSRKKSRRWSGGVKK